jgi:hypothetical protein
MRVGRARLGASRQWRERCRHRHRFGHRPTDVEGWDADAFAIETQFGFDQATGTIRNVTWIDEVQPNQVGIMLINKDDYTTSSSPSKWC